MVIFAYFVLMIMVNVGNLFAVHPMRISYGQVRVSNARQKWSILNSPSISFQVNDFEPPKR